MADTQTDTHRPTLLESNRIHSLRRSRTVLGIITHIDRARRVPSLRRIDAS